MDITSISNQLHVYLKRHRPQIMPPDLKAGLYEIVEKYIPPKKGINIFDDNDEVIENPTYTDVLMHLINKQKIDDQTMMALVKKLDNAMDQASKNPNFKPEKQSVLRAIILLRLNEIDAETLLGVCGYTLKKDQTYDLIIRFCIQKQYYDFNIIDQLLEAYHLDKLS